MSKWLVFLAVVVAVQLATVVTTIHMVDYGYRYVYASEIGLVCTVINSLCVFIYCAVVGANILTKGKWLGR